MRAQVTRPRHQQPLQLGDPGLDLAAPALRLLLAPFQRLTLPPLLCLRRASLQAAFDPLDLASTLARRSALVLLGPLTRVLRFTGAAPLRHLGLVLATPFLPLGGTALTFLVPFRRAATALLLSLRLPHCFPSSLLLGSPALLIRLPQALLHGLAPRHEHPSETPHVAVVTSHPRWSKRRREPHATKGGQHACQVPAWALEPCRSDRSSALQPRLTAAPTNRDVRFWSPAGVSWLVRPRGCSRRDAPVRGWWS